MWPLPQPSPSTPPGRGLTDPGRLALRDQGREVAGGAGLSRRALAAADRQVRIPMAQDVDSLNVGAAAAVAFYAAAHAQSSS
jgi:hypothetical protein